MTARRSSEPAYWFVRAASLVFVALFGMVCHDIFNPSNPIAEWRPSIPSATSFEALAVLLFVGGVAAAAVYAAWFRFAVVTRDEQGVTIETGKNAGATIPWARVDSFFKIPFCTPPTYRFAFRNGVEPVYFMMSVGWYVSIGFWSWDLSGAEKAVRDRLASEKRG